ncbi:MAG: translation initiation factor IF-3 [Candidatus Hydrogenedentota bacterium]
MLCRAFCVFRGYRGPRGRKGKRDFHSKERDHGTKEVWVIAKPIEQRVRVNEQIIGRQVRVIDEQGNQLGIMSPDDALRDAYERGLDLVEVAPNASPTVCRIMDYGKYKYQQSKRLKESRKHQHTIVVKEVKYRPKIDDHDFDYKTNHVREFLQEGNKVKVTITFRGREMAHPEFGQELLARIIEATKDLAQEQIDVSRLRIEGRQMVVVLSPTK